MKTNIFANLIKALAPKSMIAFLFVLAAFAQASAQDQQGLSVSGTVTFSEDNQGAPGVNVYRKGSAGQGTYTNPDGSFSFPGLLNVGDVLVFSFVGRETVEHIVSAQSTVLKIVMSPDPIQMVEEPLVMGEQSHPSFVTRVFRRAKDNR